MKKEIIIKNAVGIVAETKVHFEHLEKQMKLIRIRRKKQICLVSKIYFLYTSQNKNYEYKFISSIIMLHRPILLLLI